MDKRQRMIAAIECKPVDRPPVGFWFHFEGERAAGEACVRAHLEYYRRADPDFMKFQSDGYFGYPLESPIKSPADWRRLKPLGRKHPYIAGQVERVRRINEELRGECCTFYTVFAPFSILRFATSDELVMAHLREDRGAVLHALDVVAEDNMDLAQGIIRDGGCTGAFLPLQGGEVGRFSAEEYRELVSPSELRVIAAANEASTQNIGHLCGWAGAKNRLEVWRDYPFAVFNWAVHVEGLSLAEGRAFFRGKAVMGGFDNRKGSVIFDGTEEEIKREARRVIDAAPGTGLIVSSDCSLQMEKDIDQDHIRWVVEAAREYASRSARG